MKKLIKGSGLKINFMVLPSGVGPIEKSYGITRGVDQGSFEPRRVRRGIDLLGS